jgi:superfamily II DNA/RNA helicase
MQRIGRAGRFGDAGLALTLLESEQEEKCFWSIVDHYKMIDKVRKLDGGAKQLNKLIIQAKEDSIY